MILLELDKNEWEAECNKSPIVLPGAVQEKQEGSDKTRIPFHFFKVTQLGPDVDPNSIKLGDRLIPKPPTPDTPPMAMVVIWQYGKKEVGFITSLRSVAGVE